jgi:pSer/pThr/pTyr-binding forkhead associated (FHA) protein
VDATWYLETLAKDGSRVVHEVRKLPFRVGRDPTSDLAEATMGLSRRHAELTADISGRLRLTDMDSTNGTFVNRERVNGSVLLADNDVIHFAHAEFRIRQRNDESSTIVGRKSPSEEERTVIVPAGRSLSENFVPHEREFRSLLLGQGPSLTCARERSSPTSGWAADSTLTCRSRRSACSRWPPGWTASPS